MTRNAYVDESQRRSGYAVAAACIDHRSVNEVRHGLRALAPNGSSRRHSVRESNEVKIRMLRVFRLMCTAHRGAVKELMRGGCPDWQHA